MENQIDIRRTAKIDIYPNFCVINKCNRFIAVTENLEKAKRFVEDGSRDGVLFEEYGQEYGIYDDMLIVFNDGIGVNGIELGKLTDRCHTTLK